MIVGASAAGVAATLASLDVFAQAVWPRKPVHIVVPYTPGTGMDILARTLGPHLSTAWGQPIIVDNRPGASGNLGAGQVAKAAPDGYTLLMGVNTLIINPSLYTNMSYDPLKDLAPIGLCATGSFLLVASAAANIRSVDQLVKMARARPGALDYASPGIATPHHMAMELFKLRAGISITHIPFSGTAGAVTAVLAGDVPLMFLPVHVALAQVKSGRLVVLAAAGAHRSALAPDVPTLDELGYKGVNADLWYGMLAPAGISRDLVDQINADMTHVLEMAEVKSALSVQGMEVATSSPQEMAALMQRDAARWAAVVKQAGIKAE
ncbi:MAG: tripartite tricarboxylate transporter substrate binding protein [Pseudomonadota bacterium]|nr:tripartite tricarboxylate transporter substrate binding protein [Pseudomonadota bacterium]